MKSMGRRTPWQSRDAGAIEKGLVKAGLATLMALLLLAWITPAMAQSSRDTGKAGVGTGLVKGETAKVVEVIDGDTVTLDSGVEVRLVGIQAPKLPLNRPNFKEWPLAREAKEELEKLVLGQRVTLWYGGARGDRHGRTLAHLKTDDGTWAQGEMLGRGLARVYTFPDNRAAADELLDREASARKAKFGIWALGYYKVQDADGKVGPPDTYQLVEGTVTKVANVRGRVFLNFGTDYRKDFTATISPRDVRVFTSSGLDPAALNGKRVRLRGWLYDRNGPAMDVTHPEQVELLE
ncbi:thermonuclease family protein [Skermanella stibiiresistens]|uniref:thermonuclease family protein n=1 Tax=Skermanella stibiiresistens TaxID=913326 RepID=UPI0018DCD213|nr:thermonuclease family protein [Skermanella stibiiresistens]